jgi:cell division protease FtsH
MVTRFGMSERLGHLTYGTPIAGRYLQTPLMGETRNYSERTAEVIDEEVHRLIDESHDMSRSILMSRHDQLERIAGELIRKETLDRSALNELIGEPATKISSCLTTPTAPSKVASRHLY